MLGGGAWWAFGRGDATPQPSDGIDPLAEGPRENAPATSTPSTPKAVDAPAPDIPWEAVAREDEALPTRPRPAVPWTVPLSKDVIQEASQQGKIRGRDLLDAMVKAQAMPVRFDTARTRDQFLHAHILMPAVGASPDGTPALMLMQIAAILRHSDEFSARLDTKALWIGGYGVY